MKQRDFKKLNITMAMLLLLTLAALLSACSKDKKDGGGITCPPGSVLVNNICEFQGNVGGSGYYGIPSLQFVKNGSLTNGSSFRDFVYRYTFNYFRCFYNNIFRCNDAQVSIRRLGQDIYEIFIKSPSISPSVQPSMIPVRARRVESPSNTRGSIFESVYSNPVPYVNLELWTRGSFEERSLEYEVFFEGRSILSGIMRKGIDY